MSVVSPCCFSLLFLPVVSPCCFSLLFLPVVDRASLFDTMSRFFNWRFGDSLIVFTKLTNLFIRDHLIWVISEIGSMRYLWVVRSRLNIFRIATFHVASNSSDSRLNKSHNCDPVK